MCSSDLGVAVAQKGGEISEGVEGGGGEGGEEWVGVRQRTRNAVHANTWKWPLADSVSPFGGMCRALIAMCRFLFGMCRALFAMCRALFGMCRALFGMCRAFCGMCRAFCGMCRALCGK